MTGTGDTSDVGDLFTPFRIGRTTLSNRFVMAPMTRGFSPEGVPGPDVADYYRRRAEGGIGLIITEGTWVPHVGASDQATVPDFYGERALAGWKKVVDAVHGAGGLIMPQLWHVGLIHKKTPADRGGDDIPAGPHHVGPSGLSGGMGVPIFQAKQPMTLGEIDAVIGAYAAAARDAMRLGFDGVELHGGHGYIIDQFLWNATNRREDRYGGGHRERGQFAADLVAAIRAATAPDFPILLRFSQWKLHDYDARLAETPQELEQMLAPIVDAGVDLFDCSQRRFWEPAFAGSELNLAGWAKKLTGRPSMTIGSVALDVEFMTSLFEQRAAGVADLGALVERFASGEFDLVGVGRALIADPDWTAKVKDGRLRDARPYSPDALQSLV